MSERRGRAARGQGETVFSFRGTPREGASNSCLTRARLLSVSVLSVPVCAAFVLFVRRFCAIFTCCVKNCKLRTHSRACAMGKCFVPFCKTRYKSCKEKYSLFTPPHDPSRVEAWKRASSASGPRASKDGQSLREGFRPAFLPARLGPRK